MKISDPTITPAAPLSTPSRRTSWGNRNSTALLIFRIGLTLLSVRSGDDSRAIMHRSRDCQGKTHPPPRTPVDDKYLRHASYLALEDGPFTCQTSPTNISASRIPSFSYLSPHSHPGGRRENKDRSYVADCLAISRLFQEINSPDPVKAIRTPYSGVRNSDLRSHGTTSPLSHTCCVADAAHRSAGRATR